MKKTLVTFAAACCVAASSFALNPNQEKQFGQADKDGNGSVSPAEFVAFKTTRQMKAAEKKGKEFNKGKAMKNLEKAFGRLDKDGNKALSNDEFNAGFAKKK